MLWVRSWINVVTNSLYFIELISLILQIFKKNSLAPCSFKQPRPKTHCLILYPVCEDYRRYRSKLWYALVLSKVVMCLEHQLAWKCFPASFYLLLRNVWCKIFLKTIEHWQIDTVCRKFIQQNVNIFSWDYFELDKWSVKLKKHVIEDIWSILWNYTL